jgi:hypothetical protein
MHRSISALAIAVLALAACNRQQAADPVADATPTNSTPGAVAPVTPAHAPVASSSGKAPSFAGYHGARFGMTAQETRQAWGGALDGKAPASPGDCYLLTPASASSPHDVSLMLEGDTFVRYDIGNAIDVAPGGGKVGMDADQIRALYSGRIREQPQKYVPGGQYLRIGADDDSGSVLVFDADANGKVTGWRVGQPPAVDYVEGCS